jgi:hypothetical protein
LITEIFIPTGKPEISLYVQEFTVLIHYTYDPLWLQTWFKAAKALAACLQRFIIWQRLEVQGYGRECDSIIGGEINAEVTILSEYVELGWPSRLPLMN